MSNLVKQNHSRNHEMENTRCSATWIFIDFLETTKLKKKTPVLFCILVIAIRFIKLNFII